MPSLPVQSTAFSPRLLVAAPHRAMFFVGATLLVAAMAWWLWLLLATPLGLPVADQPLPAGWMHGLLMQYATLAPFIAGFLLTVFPRWMSVPPVPRAVYGAVFGLLVAGTLSLLLAVSGAPRALSVGLSAMLAGWVVMCAALARCIHQHRARDPWALSAWCGCAMGGIGLMLALSASVGAPAVWALAANRIATFGFLVPVYVTVAHRMVPFFAGNVIAGYRIVRPIGTLLATWLLCLAHLGAELLGTAAWRWPVDALLALVLASQWLAWQPWKARKPGLLLVLFIATAWLPLAFALYALDGFLAWRHGVDSRALAPLHALTVGFFSSMLVAMVTRVTHGHSGRALSMGVIPWLAFIGMQLAALTRVLAEYVPQPPLLYVAAAALWLMALLPWATRSLWIYLTPRRDGAPG